MDKEQALAIARTVLHEEANAVLSVAKELTDDFYKALELILNCEGHLIFSGIGKSGHIASKLAATFASTGTPSFFVHAAEAAHGDLGMITKEDTVVAISYSGESSELLTVLPTIKREGASLIAMTGNPLSSLAKHADAHLNCHVDHEACPLNLAPTNSTTVTLALGDALAVTCLKARGFSERDFARSHPGGALGRRLLTRVRDVMHKGGEIPVVEAGTPMLEAIEEISHKHLGMTAVVSGEDVLIGILTEGDIRRLISRVGDIRDLKVGDVMTRNPKTISADDLAVSAVKKLADFQCNQLLVVDDANHLIGALNLHDLLKAKVF